MWRDQSVGILHAMSGLWAVQTMRSPLLDFRVGRTVVRRLLTLRSHIFPCFHTVVCACACHARSIIHSRLSCFVGVKCTLLFAVGGYHSLLLALSVGRPSNFSRLSSPSYLLCHTRSFIGSGSQFEPRVGEVHGCPLYIMLFGCVGGCYRQVHAQEICDYYFLPRDLLCEHGHNSVARYFSSPNQQTPCSSEFVR